MGKFTVDDELDFPGECRNYGQGYEVQTCLETGQGRPLWGTLVIDL